jgi:hypothetical protein
MVIVNGCRVVVVSWNSLVLSEEVVGRARANQREGPRFGTSDW